MCTRKGKSNVLKDIPGIRVNVVDHEHYMHEALAEAAKAAEKGEVPIGAVIVLDGEIVARGHNLKEILHDSTAHAEMVAIREASQKLGRWRLTGTTLYVTVEPCSMCAGAIVQARIDTLVYGAPDPKAGAVESLMNIVQDQRLNHRVEVVSGVLKEECQEIIKQFFRNLRSSSE